MIRATLLLTAFLAAAPVYAGGPVIEDTAEPVAQTRLSPVTQALITGTLTGLLWGWILKQTGVW